MLHRTLLLSLENQKLIKLDFLLISLNSVGKRFVLANSNAVVTIFIMKVASRYDDIPGSKYHTSTHFDFGNFSDRYNIACS